MDEWLAPRADKLGASVDDAQAEAILTLARIAAHDSGQRTNAPLICFLVGVAVGRGTSFDDAVESAT